MRGETPIVAVGDTPTDLPAETAPSSERLRRPPSPSRGEGSARLPTPYNLALLDPEQCLLAPARRANSTLRPNLTQPRALMPKPPQGRSLTILIHRSARLRTQHPDPTEDIFCTARTQFLGSTEDSQISPAIGELALAYIRRGIRPAR